LRAGSPISDWTSPLPGFISLLRPVLVDAAVQTRGLDAHNLAIETRGLAGTFISACLATRIAIRVTTQAILQNKTNLLIERSFVAELETIYSYMREFSTQLGERILEDTPRSRVSKIRFHHDSTHFCDGRFPRKTLPSCPWPKDGAVSHGAHRGECGTGKTLISLSAIHVHSQGKPYTALAMSHHIWYRNGRAKPCLLSLDFVSS